MNKKNNHLFQVCIFYLIIAVSGWLSFKLFHFEYKLLSFLLVDIVMTIVCFAFSIWKRNSSMYDPYWSVIPFYYALFLVVIQWDVISIYHMITLIVVSIWSWRLTLNWARSWHGFEHEDWRYVDLADKHKSNYPLVNFFGIHMFPTLLVFAGMLPMFYIFDWESGNAMLFGIGVAISIFGTLLEFIADNQLARFRQRANPQTTDLLDTGIWGLSRNPNYLGEILFWLGIYVMGAAFAAPWYYGLGFISMVFLFVFISIPMKEERMQLRRPTYEAYKARVPMLIPRLRVK